MGESAISGQHRRFEANSDGYARFRPAYPDAMMVRLAQRIAAVPAGPVSPVLDMGSGTGIFTRQLAAHLPDHIPILGVEPAAAMRGVAEEAGGRAGIRYLDGSAENMPATGRSLRAVTAATAAHWFDRPAFYREAARVLVPGGVLAIAEYVRDTEHSPAAAAVDRFLAEHGGPRAYARPDYASELGALGPVETWSGRVELSLAMPDFIGLALSSSHARPVVAQLGQEAAEAALARLGGGLAGRDGHIPYGYRFDLLMVEPVPR